MEKYLVPPKSSPDDSTPTASLSTIRRPWKRSLIELNGRIEPDYRHELCTMIANSYSEIGRFQHHYHVSNGPCRTHISEIQNWYSLARRGVAGIEFDNQGIYIVSVTRAGCLTVHDFEALYCQSKVGSDIPEDESKHVVHLSIPRNREFDVARWNSANQNEIACTSRRLDKVFIFDISYKSSEPTEELQTRQKISILGRKISRGLSDVAFTNNGESRVVSSDTLGIVHVWDRRVGVLPCMELSVRKYDSIKSIQIYVDNQTIFGAGVEGMIHIWDLRGGRTSSVFESSKDMINLPLTSIDLAPMLRKIPALAAQSEIFPEEIHSIDVNPSSPRQLAFHLDGGWSGVVDIYNSQVTHVHCPPPSWLDGSNNPADLILRKPSWLPASSHYVVGSTIQKGINVLDFHPSSKSPCHVDYVEDSQKKDKREKFKHRNKFVFLSEYVMGCAAHPLNNMIVAGTRKSSLLLIGEKNEGES